MKAILEETYILTPEDDQTHLDIPFELIKDYEKLILKMDYSPQWVEKERAIMLMKAHLHEIIPREQLSEWGDVHKYLPLENLITLSLDYKDEYIGAHHCKDTSQHICVSSVASTKGFLKQQAAKGKWCVKMNMHCVQSETVTLNIQIFVE